METKWKVVLLTLVIAIPAFMFGAGSPPGWNLWVALWPFADGVAVVEPEGAQIGFLMFFGVLEAIALGLAISFLIWGGALVRKVAGPNKTRNNLLVVSGAWVLGNWWVHDSLHIVNGHNVWGLIVLEYAFHVTLMIAGGYIAWTLVRSLQAGGTLGTAAVAPTPAQK
jgi:hypothetical protein